MSSRSAVCMVTMIVVLGVSGTWVAAQKPATDNGTSSQVSSASVPRLVRFGGTIKDAGGTPLRGTHTLVFSIHATREGGQPLWTEHQDLEIDEGRYVVLLGASQPDGLPLDLFVSGEARWLGVEAGGVAEPRVLLLSVPYALKAADAETLAGRPASDYALTEPSDSLRIKTSAAKDPIAAAAPAPGGGTEKAARWQATSPTGPGFIADATTGPPLQVASTDVVANLNSDLLDGFNSLDFARLAAPNNFTAGQVITNFSGTGLIVHGADGIVGATATASTGGIAVRGQASATTGTATGVQGESFATSGTGVIGRASASSGVTSGVQGLIFSPAGTAGVFDAPNGATLLLGRGNGITRFRVDADGALLAGTGKFASSSAPEVLRVDSNVTSAGYGIVANATGPAGTGVFGWATGVSGYGLYGESSNNAGSGAGVYGKSNSASGLGGLFENGGGGDIIQGRVGTNVRFRVDNAGNVYAASFRDAGGAAIPNGDVTAVSAGTGLTGGGTTGDISLALDTAFADARYAAATHTHNVSQIANAATLGSNSFAGNQLVTGNVIASGKVEGASSDTFGYGVKGSASGQGFAAGVVGASTDSNGVGVRGEVLTTSGLATGVRGISASVSGVGVRGEATSSTGVATGVRGDSSADIGTGVSGRANSTTGQGIGVRGESSGATGMGVLAYASSTTGAPLGLRAVVEKDGIAGAFEVVNGAGDLIVGRTGPISGQYTNRFRVDGTGAVYATAYKDLNGNPIPTGTGDVTAVAAGAGLTGGGASGDLSLALDTSFTNGLYASKVHTHAVADVSNAASLGANTFTGNQTVGGNLSVTGTISAPQLVGIMSGPLATFATMSAVNTDTSQVTQGILGRSHSSAGTGIIAEAIAATGSTHGLKATAASTSGIAIRAEAPATTGVTRGVLGLVGSADGVGVEGVANAGIGVRGLTVNGTGVKGRRRPVAARVPAFRAARSVPMLSPDCSNIRPRRVMCCADAQMATTCFESMARAPCTPLRTRTWLVTRSRPAPATLQLSQAGRV